MFPFVRNYIARKIDITKNLYNQSMIKKELEKIRYDKRVKTYYFKPNYFVLLKNSTPYLNKLTEQWRGLFIIDSFGQDHNTSYVLKALDRKSGSNTHHGDYLCIFCPQEGYLRPTNKKLL